MANPPSRPPRGDVGGSRRGNPSGASSTEAFVASGRMLNGNNVEGMLGTPPRLPRPLADGMIVGAAKEAARWLAVDDRTWHQVRGAAQLLLRPNHPRTLALVICLCTVPSLSM